MLTADPMNRQPKDPFYEKFINLDNQRLHVEKEREILSEKGPEKCFRFISHKLGGNSLPTASDSHHKRVTAAHVRTPDIFFSISQTLPDRKRDQNKNQ
jgi:hypothetical protein